MRLALLPTLRSRPALSAAVPHPDPTPDEDDVNSHHHSLVLARKKKKNGRAMMGSSSHDKSTHTTPQSHHYQQQQQLVPYHPQKHHRLAQDLILSVDKYNHKAQVIERIEVTLAYRQGRRVIEIVCVPQGEPERNSDLRRVGSTDESVLYESPYDEAASSTPSPFTQSSSFLEEFARSVLDPCQCQPFLKPALRKEKRPADEGIRNSVSFDTVDIKEFGMTLGDHPSAASGPPVALDWERVERERCVDLDEYEASRVPRRSRRQLKLSLRDRKGILQTQFSADEVNKAWQEARAIREQRKETVQRGLFMMFMDDMVETANRRMSRVGESLSSVIL